jgi:N-acyl-D-amino-acid deacylase
MPDLLVRGGLVVDGTGSEPRQADVLIRHGVIVAVEAGIDAVVDREIDATGLLVTPGFVDIHTHYDGQATWDTSLSPSSGHGVTTVVMGNCGVGFAPCRPESRAGLIRLMEGIEDIPEAVMTHGLPWAWESFPEYLDFLDARKFDIDVAAQLPHAALRVFAMGDRGMARDAANEDDLLLMGQLAYEAIDAGALGFSTSRSVNHRSADGAPTPSLDAAERELHAIAAGVARTGRGVLQVISDFPSPEQTTDRMRLLVELAERSGRPLSFTLAQFHHAPHSWEVALRLTERAVANGVPIRGQVYPRPMGVMMSLEASLTPFDASATYAGLAPLSREARVERMRAPSVRAQIVSEAQRAGSNPLTRNFEWVFPLRQAADYEPPMSTSVAAQAASAGVSPDEVAYDVLLENEGRGVLNASFANLADGSLEPALAMMKSDATVIGLGDGGAHYGIISDSSYPTFMLSYWGRDRTKGERLPLAFIVKSLSKDTAEAVGLRDRGVLQPGYKADLNVIDFDALSLGMPTIAHDLPAQGRRLLQAAEGFRATVVSGEVTVRDGKATSARPGRLVRGQQPAPD